MATTTTAHWSLATESVLSELRTSQMLHSSLAFVSLDAWGRRGIEGSSHRTPTTRPQQRPMLVTSSSSHSSSSSSSYTRLRDGSRQMDSPSTYTSVLPLLVETVAPAEAFNATPPSPPTTTLTTTTTTNHKSTSLVGATVDVVTESARAAATLRLSNPELFFQQQGEEDAGDGYKRTSQQQRQSRPSPPAPPRTNRPKTAIFQGDTLARSRTASGRRSRRPKKRAPSPQQSSSASVSRVPRQGLLPAPPVWEQPVLYEPEPELFKEGQVPITLFGSPTHEPLAGIAKVSGIRLEDVSGSTSTRRRQAPQQQLVAAVEVVRSHGKWQPQAAASA